MDNLDVARVLRELGDLLEIQGANPFRVRAYRNAVQTVEGLTRPLARMVEEGEDLTELPAIGKDISGYIEELVRTGRLGILEDVAREVPRELAKLTRLDGVGPKRARKLWQELDVTTVEELETAIEAGEVQELEGFGAKSAEKMLRAIGDYRKHSKRFLLSDADQLVQPLLAYLEESSDVLRAEVAGSFRRRKETVGDVDILVLCREGSGRAVMDHFTAYASVERTERAGETRGTVVLRSGLSVDLRIVPETSYGAALHYFTGSKEHNVEVRKLGVRKGLRINEYGVYRIPDGVDPEAMEEDEGEWVGGETEEEVFQAVGMAWVPPVLRTNRGEIRAALENSIPRLVDVDDLKGDLQMHSTWTDGKQSIRQMAEACRDRGYEYLAITDHSQAVTMVGGLDPEKARRQWEEIDRVREEVRGIHLFRSMEVDILRDGELDQPDEILAELDLVVISVHSFMNLSGSEMTRRVIRAMEHPEVDILAHPTGRLINQREPYEIDMEEVLQAARALDVAMEINANPNRLDLSDVHAYRARELGVKTVISTDAHSIANLDLMSYGVDQARRAWLGPEDVLNALPLGDFRRWLERRET